MKYVCVKSTRISDHWSSGAGDFFLRGGHLAAAVPRLRARRTEGVCLVLEDLLVHAHYGTFLTAGLIVALPKELRAVGTRTYWPCTLACNSLIDKSRNYRGTPVSWRSARPTPPSLPSLPSLSCWRQPAWLPQRARLFATTSASRCATAWALATSLASTMTRTSGSVPDLRSSTRPTPSSSA